jgi:hypothetical protein
MSDRDPPKRRVDPNATIEIQLDQVQLVDPNAPPAPEPRKTPPPLPMPEELPVLDLPPPRSAGKAIAYVALVVVLVGMAIVGGLMVGMHARGGATTAPAPSATTLATAAAPTTAPAASSAAPTLTLPTIEMH